MYKIGDDIYKSINGAVEIAELSTDKRKTVLKTVSDLYVDADKKGIWL